MKTRAELQVLALAELVKADERISPIWAQADVARAAVYAELAKSAPDVAPKRTIDPNARCIECGRVAADHVGGRSAETCRFSG